MKTKTCINISTNKNYTVNFKRSLELGLSDHQASIVNLPINDNILTINSTNVLRKRIFNATNI